jgi:hypothetical protein
MDKDRGSAREMSVVYDNVQIITPIFYSQSEQLNIHKLILTVLQCAWIFPPHLHPIRHFPGRAGLSDRSPTTIDWSDRSIRTNPGLYQTQNQ